VNPQGRFNPYRDNNEILPQAIYVAANIRDNYGNIKWYLAEIGIAMDRQSEGEPGADGVIDDTFRIQLMEEHLVQLHRDSRRRELLWRAPVDVYRQLVVDQCLQTALRLLATGSGDRRATDKTQCAVVCELATSNGFRR
jgi:6-phospho-beta-glucosidase